MRSKRKMRNMAAPRGWAQAMVIILVCACFATALAQPAVKIRENADAKAGDVTVSVDVSDFDLTGKGHGYIVYYLDAPAPTYYEHSAISKAGTYAVSAEASHTWTNVTPGEHVVSVQLVDSRVMPLPEPVTDRVTVSVGAPDGGAQVSIANPADGDSLPPGNIRIVVDVRNFIISKEDMGVVTRDGEGHLIYYIDEDPPTDPGAPATTDTSAVSADTSRLWKKVTQGSHTFSVQLVNNDDTPLATPVTAAVTLDVKP